MEQQLAPGRILHYKLSPNDCARINARRTELMNGSLPLSHAQEGNAVREGDVVPMIVVRVWPNEFSDGRTGVNGQAFLDGDDTLWVLSAGEGTGLGEWQWPVKN